MKKFALTRDVNGYNAYGLVFTSDNYQMKLSANTVVSVTAPTEFTDIAAVFAYEPGSTVWVAVNDNTITAATGAPASTNAQMLPALRQIKSGDVVSFVTDDTTAEVGVSFYNLTLKF